MPARDERRELVPVTIATIVLAIGSVFIWSDIRAGGRSLDGDAVTSSVVSRAGATLTPLEPPTHLVVPRTAFVSPPSTVGRSAR